MAPETYYPEPVEPVLRRFVEDFRNVYGRDGDTAALLPSLRGPVETLLHDPSWVGEEYLRAIPGSTAAYAIYRSQDPETVAYCFRFSDDMGKNWIYADLAPGGSADGFSVASLPTITVQP